MLQNDCPHANSKSKRSTRRTGRKRDFQIDGKKEAKECENANEKMWKSMCVCKSLIEQIKNTISFVSQFYPSFITYTHKSTWKIFHYTTPRLDLCAIKSNKWNSRTSNKHIHMLYAYAHVGIFNIIHLMRFVLEIFIIPHSNLRGHKPLTPPFFESG